MIELTICLLIAIAAIGSVAGFWLGYINGWKWGQETLRRQPLDYPGFPENFDQPATFEDFKHPRIMGIRLPEIE